VRGPLAPYPEIRRGDTKRKKNLANQNYSMEKLGTELTESKNTELTESKRRMRALAMKEFERTHI